MIRRTAFVPGLAFALATTALLAPGAALAQNSWPIFHPILATQRQLPCGESVHDEASRRDEAIVMTFDPRGHVLTRTATTRGDTGSRVTTYHYDAQGHLTSEDFSDGDQVFRVTYTLDANGRPATREMQGARGRLRMRITWEPQGGLSRVEYDNDADGSIDMVEAYTYDHGHIATFEQRMGDRVQYTERYTYDARGRLTRMERDMMNNGTVDLRRTYVYDARGRLMREENDRRADGTVDETRTYRYECR